MSQIDTATDAELVELFSMDSVDDLIASAFNDHRGFLQHDVCDGTWKKYPNDEKWKFYPDPEI